MTNDLPSQSSPQLLRSCLRQGSFSRGGVSNNERRAGGGSIRTYSSAPSQAMLQYEYSQQQQQTRQEESCSRSAASDPARMTREYNLRTRSPSHASSSYPILTPHIRNNNTSNGNHINVVEDSERQFMRISQLLYTQHMTAAGGGRHNDSSSYALQLIFQHLPTIELRLSFYNTLQRNSEYLPIFPEANEHPSIAITRYIEKIFGPILAREIKTGSSSGEIVVGGYCQFPTMSYATQRYPQHYLQSNQNDLSDVYQRQRQSIQSQSPPLISQGMLSPSLTMSRHPQHSERPRVDEPLFPPPSTNVNQYAEIDPSRQAHISLTNPPFEQLWNVNEPSVEIPPSPAVSRTGSGVPTPMASNISTKTAPTIYQQSLNVTFASPRSESEILSSRLPYSPPSSSKSQSRQSFSFESPSNNNNKVYRTTELLSPVDDRSSVNTPSLLGISTESSNASEEEDNKRDDNGGDGKYGDVITPRTKKCINEITTESSVSSVVSISEYQTLSNRDMLPPMKSRESILYYPNNTSKTTTCCDDGAPSPRLHGMIRKRPPSYLQLYVKCERSEPFMNEDLDIVTWYRNASDSRVTAERTLVVRNTTNMIDLIGGIIESFGLTTSPNNNTEYDDNGIGKELSQGCYKSVCFISDVKTRESEDTDVINLTPLPIPGLRYKYVDRSCGGNTSKGKGDKGREHNSSSPSSSSSSVLAMDPYGLRLILVGQLLDKSIHKYPSSVMSNEHNIGNDYYAEGVRNRLALVFCTPKRRAYISPRSTIQGVLPETIYHFQLILEGVVSEDNLPSSFQSQTAIRCVSATGGVLGGSVIDTKDEINELNRKLWKGRDVVGLYTPKSNRQQNLERIIDLLGVPLFDVAGNQTPKEFVVDRCLYDMYSGKLSMNLAQKTQDTVEAIEGTTEWLARRVDDFAKTLTACDDGYHKFEKGKFDEFDAAVSRFENKFIK